VAALNRLARAGADWPAPALEVVARSAGDPYAVLVGTVLSLRTRDAVTLPATRRLLALTPDAASLAAADEAAIAEAIRPVAFHRVKAGQLRGIGAMLLAEWNGAVPRTLVELLRLPGVGRKTANLTLGLGHGLPAVCVDVHVHRIANRLGWLTSRTPDETEALLCEKIPRRHWLRINALLVPFGQVLCRPQSPHCSRCPLARHCPRHGVARSR
jgi:endonuclease-3